MKNTKLTGFKTYRHEQNPKEKELHDKFIAEHIEGEKYTSLIDFLVFPTSSSTGKTPSDYLTNREKQIMISTIQWLGSPVGLGFLEICGFELKK